MKSVIKCVWLGLSLVVFSGIIGSGLAADTHVIVGTQQVNWTYNSKASTPSQPLVVDDLKVGDTIDIQIPAGPIPHGFITITKAGSVPATETKDLVLACGETATSKPNAVLQEVNCGAASQFGVRFKGSMQLQVMPNFKGDVNFWCIVHHAGMAGVLRLKQ